VDAGWDQLIESGYERFTIDAVAERSSSARSVLYRRWPSRLDLLKAVIRHRGQVDSNSRVVHTSGADLVRHELFLTMTAATPETLTEIVDDIFLPLATNFGNSCPSPT
jgi:AcrR family transcriptional regulator